MQKLKYMDYRATEVCKKHEAVLVLNPENLHTEKKFLQIQTPMLSANMHTWMKVLGTGISCSVSVAVRTLTAQSRGRGESTAPY